MLTEKKAKKKYCPMIGDWCIASDCMMWIPDEKKPAELGKCGLCHNKEH